MITPVNFKSLQQKILLSVSVVSLLLAILASEFSYLNEFNRANLKTASMIEQLLDTVENTAAIAAYSKDPGIAQDVVNGLLKNDIVNSVQIISVQGFDLKQTKNSVNNIEEESIRALYAPFGERRVIGYLRIQPSTQYTLTEARYSAIQNAINSVLLIMVTAMTILWLIRVYFSNPLAFVSKTLHAIKDGEKQRIPQLKNNKNDELGCLVEDINGLLLALENKFNEERLLREKIEIVEQRLRLIFNSTSAGLFLLNQTGHVLASNLTLKSILKIAQTDDNALPNDYLITDFFNEQTQFSALLEKALKSGQLEYQDFSLKSAPVDSPIWLHCLVSKVITAAGEIGIEGVLFNVTERVKNEQAVKHEAEHDPLTGLLRRLPAQMAFEAYVGSCQNPTAAIFLLDLDGFKQVNDTYGHLAGDKVLILAAQRLSACVRSSDVVSRLGGDEFLVVLINCEPVESKATIATNIINALRKPMLIDEHEVQVGVSLGISSLTREKQDFELLIQTADKAMYEVKRQGKNGYCFYDAGMMLVKLFRP